MIRFSDGNDVRLLNAGREYFPALETLIDAAREEIYLETYIFADDAAGQRIAAALIRAAHRGVTARVLVDGFGSKAYGDTLFAELISAGVQLLVYRPDISPFNLRRSRLRRLHRKVVVVDACAALVGGINIIDDMHTPRQRPPRVDFAVTVRGPIVDEIHAAVTRLWVIVSWSQLRQRWRMWSMRCVPNAESGSQRAAFLIRDNLGHRREIEEAYLEAIGAARQEIIIAMAYFLPGVRFRHALAQAAARGVRVILLLQGRVEYFFLHHATRALYGTLLDAGIEIQEYHKSFLHAKVAVIDSYWATVGSSNIDPFSLFMAREANVVVEDQAFAQELRGSLVSLIDQGARRVVHESWSKQPLPGRVLAWLSYGLFRLSNGVLGYAKEQENG